MFERRYCKAPGTAGRVVHVLWMLALFLTGCAGTPQHGGAGDHSAASVADRAALFALRMVGRPYRYGGAHADAGFDCSGLVQYSYRQAGLNIPRTTDEQWRISTPVGGSRLRRGDLLFFDQEGRKNSHMGIYLGNGEFVHAPSSGKQVRTDRLDAHYWRRHFSGARRLEI
jgi:murein DD-endopeptidase